MFEGVVGVEEAAEALLAEAHAVEDPLFPFGSVELAIGDGPFVHGGGKVVEEITDVAELAMEEGFDILLG